MKVELRMVGKTSLAYLREGMAIYEKRLARYADFNTVIIPDVKASKRMDKRQLMEKEGEAILAKCNKSEYLILLDDRGKAFTSPAFARQLADKWLPCGRKLVFQIGGAYGFSEAVYERADARLSLSPMTFSHQMVRLFFLEQLYRGFSIINNEPYHHA